MGNLKSCSFCKGKATWKYEPRTYFCYPHLVWFYIALESAWHD